MHNLYSVTTFIFKTVIVSPGNLLTCVEIHILSGQTQCICNFEREGIISWSSLRVSLVTYNQNWLEPGRRRSSVIVRSFVAGSKFSRVPKYEKKAKGRIICNYFSFPLQHRDLTYIFVLRELVAFAQLGWDCRPSQQCHQVPAQILLHEQNEKSSDLQLNLEMNLAHVLK